MAIILFAGCATPTFDKWEKYGASQADFASDLQSAEARWQREREIAHASHNLSSAITGVYGGINPASVMPVMKGHSLSIYLKEMGWRKKTSKPFKSSNKSIERRAPKDLSANDYYEYKKQLKLLGFSDKEIELEVERQKLKESGHSDKQIKEKLKSLIAEVEKERAERRKLNSSVRPAKSTP